MSCSPLDRVTPARRPTGCRVAGHQRWRNLLFLHWPVPVAAMRAAVPDELELDLWEGQALVGIVPFEMKDIRPAWLPRALALDFLEANVRTYVHHRGEPGVFFLSLEASSRLAVQAARWGWGLPYHHARMHTTHAAGEIAYTSQRRRDARASLHVRYLPDAHLGPSPVGTLEHFLLERYLLFVRRRGRIFRGQVHHAPYPAQRVELLLAETGLFAAAGLPFPAGAPQHAHFAAGLDVEVFGLRPA